MILLGYNTINEFCRCASIISGKGNQLGIVCDGGSLHLFVKDYKSCVEYKGVVESKSKFNLGVSLDKFVLVNKKFYDGNISFSVKGSKLILQQGNMVVRLPISDPIEKPRENLELKQVFDEKLQWVLKSMVSCNFSVSDSDTLKGVMIDHTSDVVKVCKLSGSTVTVVSGTACLPDCNKRYVVSSDMVGIFQTLKAKIKSIGFSEDLFSAVLESGVSVYSCLLQDDLPLDYTTALGLVNDYKLIDENEFDKYVFERSELFSAIDASMVISDSKRAFVSIESVGFEGSSHFMVWKVTCKSSDGSVIEEKFTCSEVVSNSKGTKFILSGKDLVKALEMKSELINLYDKDDKPIVISNLEMNEVTLLIKSVGL